MSRSPIVRGAILGLSIACSACIADVTAEQQQLIDTDREWAALASSGKNADSLIGYWSDSARIVMAGQPTFVGKEAIRRMVMSNFSAPGFHISWNPERAIVSKSGDIGYTTGTNEFIIPDGKGNTMKVAGRYIAVWRKEGGRWRCVEDFSTPVA